METDLEVEKQKALLVAWEDTNDIADWSWQRAGMDGPPAKMVKSSTYTDDPGNFDLESAFVEKKK